MGRKELVLVTKQHFFLFLNSLDIMLRESFVYDPSIQMGKCRMRIFLPFSGLSIKEQSQHSFIQSIQKKLKQINPANI